MSGPSLEPTSSSIASSNRAESATRCVKIQQDYLQSFSLCCRLFLGFWQFLGETMRKTKQRVQVTGNLEFQDCLQAFSNEITHHKGYGFPHGEIREEWTEAHAKLMGKMKLLIREMGTTDLAGDDRADWDATQPHLIAHLEQFQSSWEQFVLVAGALYDANHTGGGVSPDALPHPGELVLGAWMHPGGTQVGWVSRPRKPVGISTSSRCRPARGRAKSSENGSGAGPLAPERHELHPTDCSLELSQSEKVSWFLGVDAVKMPFPKNHESEKLPTQFARECASARVQQFGKDWNWIADNLESLLLSKGKAKPVSYIEGSVWAVVPKSSSHQKTRIVRMTSTLSEPLIGWSMEPTQPSAATRRDLYVRKRELLTRE
jgi:hypothetical protein